MGLKDIANRARGSSVHFSQNLSPNIAESSRPRSGSTLNASTRRQSADEKTQDTALTEATDGHQQSVSSSSNGRTLVINNTGSTGSGPHSPDARRDQRTVNTVPPFVVSLTDDDDDIYPGPDAPLLIAPETAFVATHHYLPDSRKHLSSRDAAAATDHGDIPIPTDSFPFPTQSSDFNERATFPQPVSRWATISRLGFPHALPTSNSSSEKIVPYSELTGQADYSQPWNYHEGEDEIESTYVAFRRKRQVWYRRFQHTLLRSPIVPLIFRMTVLAFSAVALGLGAKIHSLTDDHIVDPDTTMDIESSAQKPSSEMAVIVDAIAIPYICYITWDEYTGKPLGLRSAKAKMRLIFLDLFFIVFDSANLALAFESLGDLTSYCNDKTSPKIDPICGRQKALAAVLLIALVAWMMTFSISVLRLVERVTR